MQYISGQYILHCVRNKGRQAISARVHEHCQYSLLPGSFHSSVMSTFLNLSDQIKAIKYLTDKQHSGLRMNGNIIVYE